MNNLNSDFNESNSKLLNEVKNVEAKIACQFKDCENLIHTKLSEEQVMKICENNNDLVKYSVGTKLIIFKNDIDNKMKEIDQNSLIINKKLIDNIDSAKEDIENLGINLNNKLDKLDIIHLDGQFKEIRKEYTESLNSFNRALNNYEIKLSELKKNQVKLEGKNRKYKFNN